MSNEPDLIERLSPLQAYHSGRYSQDRAARSHGGERRDLRRGSTACRLHIQAQDKGGITITNQDKKQFLRRYQSCEREIQRTQEEIERWESRAEKTTVSYCHAGGGGVLRAADAEEKKGGSSRAG